MKVVKRVRKKEDYMNMLNYLVLSLYTMHPPRRRVDYSLMKISNNMNDDKYNYLDLKKVNLKSKLKNKNYDVHFLKTFYNEPIEKVKK